MLVYVPKGQGQVRYQGRNRQKPLAARMNHISHMLFSAKYVATSPFPKYNPLNKRQHHLYFASLHFQCSEICCLEFIAD